MAEVRFNEAFEILAHALAGSISTLPKNSLIIRDLYGKLHLAVPDSAEKASEIETSLKSCWESLGIYGSYTGKHVYSNEDFFDSEKVFNNPDIALYRLSDIGIEVRLLDRQVNGQGWSMPITKGPHPPRIAFYGVKGGVGRSTALAMAAYHAGRMGKNVLLLDFDLESPGLSGILLKSEQLPEFGAIDWFVEDAVGQSASLPSRMISTSNISRLPGVSGRIDIIPAFGQGENEYIPKLSRIYLDVPSGGGTIRRFIDRASTMLEALESELKPDIVFIDTRAGLHDLAAASIVGLSDSALLFATDTPQTWEGYRLLLSFWKDRPAMLDLVKQKLTMVYALMPEYDPAKSFAAFKEHSYGLFLENFYQEIPAGADPSLEVFSFDLENESAPHYPVAIKWNQSFLDFSEELLEKRFVTDSMIDTCYGAFFERLDEICGSEA